MMRVRRSIVCRGAGKAFIKAHIAGVEQEAIMSARATTPEGKGVPVALFPLAEARRTHIYLIAIPLLDVPYIDIYIESTGPGKSVSSSEFRIHYSFIKWQSRLNYLIRRKSYAAIKEYGQDFSLGILNVKNMRYLEDDDRIVWRCTIEWQGSTDAIPKVQVEDGEGNPIQIEPLLFEAQEVRERTTIEPVHKRITYSIKLPKSLSSFLLKTSDESERYNRGFYGIDNRMYERLKYETWQFMKDARSDDANYRRWLQKYRVSQDTLLIQKKQRFDYAPLISIVTPCFQSSTDFLRDAVGSVSAQSYHNWELLLLDASPESGVVSKFIASMTDKRVRYIDLKGNGGIVENTNRGIREANGEYLAFLDHDDILEPDALFEYVKSINENPDVALLYCDEDVFKKKDEYGWPLFKTQLNLDLLYSYNCVTHFLMVQAAFLKEIGLSSQEVSGAQDYDLTLRVFEAGGRIIHIPRILYHWRTHDGSTSGGKSESKPYAEEAGRLALQSHFERRAINAHVETTSCLFVYRVRYELPDPQPEVSVIIPNKDHIDMLDACIKSIIDRSTYSYYQIIVVENNSEEPETFQYYDAIQKKYACISVVTWEHEFNYSKIINYGVAHTSSEYVLLLNNDTQVISSDFIEEMLGYLQRQEVGLVGAKLYFHDDLVQHAGMLIGPYGAVAHVNQDFTSKRDGYLGRAVRPGNFSSVTGACQMVKRSVFDQVKGYSEEFAVGFNDVDFCLKVWRAGYRVAFTPYAELYHREFVSRGREIADETKLTRWKMERELFEQTWPECFDLGDPFTNPNLNHNSFYYALPEVTE